MISGQVPHKCTLASYNARVRESVPSRRSRRGQERGIHPLPTQPTDTGPDPRSSVAGAAVRRAEAHDETRKGGGSDGGG